LLTAIVLANYRGGEKQSALLRSTHRLAQDLRQAEEMAMACQKTKIPSESIEEFFPRGGYGVYFVKNSDSYILFGDCDGEGDYDHSGSFTCDEATSGIGNSCKETIEGLSLEEGIKIKELQLKTFGNELLLVDSLSITFIPPDPEVKISGGKKAFITLCLKDNESIFRTITVNKAGLIDTD